MEQVEVSGRQCAIVGEGSVQALIICPVDARDVSRAGNLAQRVSALTQVPFAMVAVGVADWQQELTPWPAPAAFGKVPFGQGAADTLRFLTEELEPWLRAKRFAPAFPKHCLLGGYSLAGLFALWAGYNTNRFDGIAAVSPSVWYPDWTAYVLDRHARTRLVYLSLGEGEDRGRDGQTSITGSAIRLQHETLVAQGTRNVLEWNEGNHFSNPDGRLSRGLAWLLGQIAEP